LQGAVTWPKPLQYVQFIASVIGIGDKSVCGDLGHLLINSPCSLFQFMAHVNSESLSMAASCRNARIRIFRVRLLLQWAQEKIRRRRLRGLAANVVVFWTVVSHATPSSPDHTTHAVALARPSCWMLLGRASQAPEVWSWCDRGCSIMVIDEGVVVIWAEKVRGTNCPENKNVPRPTCWCKIKENK